MFEPGIKRIAATLTEWHGEHGKAMGDDGVLYEIDEQQRTDSKPLFEPKIGERLEIYLHLDEHRQINRVTFNAMPTNETTFTRLEGEHFHFQFEKLKQEFMCHLAEHSGLFSSRFVYVACSSLFFSLWSVTANICILLLVLLLNIVMAFYDMKQQYKQEDGDWAFTFSEPGLLMNAQAIEADKADLKFKMSKNRKYLIPWSAFHQVREYENHGLIVQTRPCDIYWDNQRDANLTLWVKSGVGMMDVVLRTDLLSDSDKILLEQKIHDRVAG